MNESEKIQLMMDKFDEWNRNCLVGLKAALAMRNQAMINGDKAMNERATEEMKFWRSMII